MDALISALNQRISNEVAKNKPADIGGVTGKQSFAEILDAKNSDKLLDKITDNMKQSGGDIKVIAADNIQVNPANLEIEKSSNFDAKGKVMELFSGLNDDLNNLDSAIEVLCDPGVKLSRRQLLAYQAGIGQFALTAEMSSKMVQAGTTSLQTILNTNIG